MPVCVCIFLSFSRSLAFFSFFLVAETKWRSWRQSPLPESKTQLGKSFSSGGDAGRIPANDDDDDGNDQVCTSLIKCFG